MSRSNHNQPRPYLTSRVKELLNRVSSKKTNGDGDTVLHEAAKEKNQLTLKILLKYAPVNTMDMLEICNNTDETALSIAVQMGDVAMCKQLIQAGANVNHSLKNEEGKLLHRAIRQNHIEVAKVLLQHSANLHTQDKKGNTPLHVVATKGFQDGTLVKSIIKKIGHDETIMGQMLSHPNKDGHTPLHLAARRGDSKLVTLLLKHGVPIDEKSHTGETALHLAAHNGCDQTAKILIDKHKHIVNTKNDKGHFPLHEAVAAGNVNIVQLILQEYAGDEKLFKAFIEKSSVLPKDWVMNIAIENGQEKIVALLIDHCHWESFLLLDYNEEKQRCTPMRNLIKSMPHMASLVMDKCWQDKQHNPPSVKAHYQLVDDMFCSWKPNQTNTLFANNEDNSYDMCQPYPQDDSLLRKNHPLQMIACQDDATHLMDHPLIKALLRRKWKIATYFYFSFLFYYLLYLGLLTTLMFQSNPPFGHQTCENTSSSGSSEVPPANIGLRESVYLLAVFGAILEIMQLVLVKCKRYFEVSNISDWFTYVCPFIVFGASSSCGERMHWQWQLGVACLFVAYINMLFYLRIVPLLGIYIMMVTLMLRNFLQFFLIVLLFLLSFGICFYLLLQNQISFSTLGFSMMKSYTMMLGDVDFTGIFLDQLESDDADVALHYAAMVWVLYIAFLVLMALVMMNLLTSLAVDGVQRLMEDSQHKIFALQITLALDVEFALPMCLHKKFKCVVKTEEFLKAQNNPCVACLISCKHSVFYGSLCKEDIGEQAREIVETGRSATANIPLRKDMEKSMDDLTKRQQIDNMDMKLDDITDLLTKILPGEKLTEARQNQKPKSIN